MILTQVLSNRTILVASDNNLFFSNGRSRSRDRKGPLVAVDTDIILIRLATPLDVDRRLLPSAMRASHAFVNFVE